MGMAFSEYGGDKLTQLEKRAKRRAIRQLHDAVVKNNLALVEELMSPELDVNFHYGGQTALQLAVLKGFEDICQVLINHEADVDKTNAENNCLLNMAAWKGYSNIVQMLVSHGAELNTSNSHGSTSLNTAAYRGYPTITQILIDAGAFIDKPNLQQQTPLFVSCKRGHYSVAKLLIEAGCDLNWADVERKSPLFAAAEKGHSRIVQLLVDSGCGLNLRERYGATALLVASKNGNADCVEILIQAGANVNLCDTKNQTPFFEAVKGQHLEIVDILAKGGSDLNIGESDYEYKPIHVAIREACQYFGKPDKQMSMVQKLISAGCDLNVADRSGWTPLHQTCFGGQEDITRLLLAENVHLNIVNELGDSHLHGAMFGNKVKIVDLLIKAGAHVNQVNKKNQTPLYTAVDLRGNLEIIRLLLVSGSDVNICENEHHQSPLFAALLHQYIEVVHVLVSAGCDVNIPNSAQDSPLYVACEKGLEDMVDLLLKQPGIKLDAGKKHIPLHGAASKGFFKITEKLLLAGAKVNRMSDTCLTALLHAADADHLDIAQLLIKYGANPSIHHKVPGPWKCCVFYSDDHPHLELEAIYSAVKNNNFAMLKLVLSSTAKMPYYSLKTLRDIIFRTGYFQEARLKPQLLVQYAEFFSDVCTQPRSLQQECRGVVRTVLRTPPFKMVSLLPLPAKLKDYLLLKDLIPDVIKKDDGENELTWDAKNNF